MSSVARWTQIADARSYASPGMALRILVSDLLSKPGHTRTESASLPVRLVLEQATVDDVAEIALDLTGLSDGVVAKGRAGVAIELVCNRCLVEWTDVLQTSFEQVFRFHPDDEDEELPLEQGAWIDLEPVVHDELSLAVPLTPLCRGDCKGLCPTCGNDLNIDPCAGHGEEASSPFAALKQLFET